MSLEERIKPFMLDKEKEYDRANFVKTGKSYQDFAKWTQTLQKDPANRDAIQKAGKAFYKTPNFYYTARTDPRPDLEEAVSVLTDNRARYAEAKYSELTSGLDENTWMSLVSSVHLYKTGNKEYDKAISAINESKKMDEASESVEKMVEFLLKKAQKGDGLFQASVERGIQNESYIKALFNLYHRENNEKYNEVFHDEKGNLKKGLAKAVFEASLNVAKKAMEDEKDEGDKSDLWEDDVRPYYLVVDQAKYLTEKKQNDIDRDNSKDPQTQERKKARKSIGLSH